VSFNILLEYNDNLPNFENHPNLPTAPLTKFAPRKAYVLYIMHNI